VRENVRFGLLFPADVEGHEGDVGEADVDEEARGGEAGSVQGCDSVGEVGFLGFGEGADVVDFVVGHCCWGYDEWWLLVWFGLVGVDDVEQGWM
jgi:hypothetical protein